MANRLAAEASAYLRQHAQNPVDWHPWGPEAHALARATNRPILLSVGYSACHWCHVMAHESFDNPDTARLMNEGFVCIKVDREERPDVDQLYQGVVQLTGRGGGWPLTVFLTPELTPFWGGTYFPPVDRHGLPGFPRLLASILETWTLRRADVQDAAQELTSGLRSLMAAGLGGVDELPTEQDLVQAGERLCERMDPVHGGFAGAPKFPSPGSVELLLRAFRRSGNAGLRDQVRLALDRMSTGGVYDQLGGGFHRYSVDERWVVPHFEKMLYDNALLLRLFSHAQAACPGPRDRAIVLGIVTWLTRELTSPEGGFYSSQDADAAGEEGSSFVWTPAEIDAVLGPELGALARRAFGVTERGNFEGERTVLSFQAALDRGEEEALDKARVLLLAARGRRPAPGRDEKILAGWNGLAIGGLSLASVAFHEPGWALLASRAAEFVLEHHWNGHDLARSFAGGKAQHRGLLEDYGDLAEGLVHLYGATFEARWLDAAAALIDRALALFWDPGAQAFRAAPSEGEQLPVPVWSLHDDAWPAGASTLATAQVALAALTQDSERLAQVRAYLSKIARAMRTHPFGFGWLWAAADALMDGAPGLLIRGPCDLTAPLVAEARSHWTPTLSIAQCETPPEGVLRGPFLDKAAGIGATAYLCSLEGCQPPATTPEALRPLLGHLRPRNPS